MPFLGSQPAELALTTGSLGDDIVTEAKMANDAIGLAELKAGTDGELITWDASGNPAAVAVGTATHVLTSNGAGAAPTFQAASGAYELKQQGSYSSSQAEVTFTGLTHDFYILHLWNVNLSASEPLMIAISYDNGSNYSNAGGAATALAQHWYSTNHVTRNNGDIATEGRHGTTSGQTELTGYGSTYKPAATATNLFGTMTIDRKKDGEAYPGGMCDWSYHNAGYAPVRCNNAWFHTALGGTLGDMDAFKIYPNSGTFSDIHYKLYGTNVT